MNKEEENKEIIRLSNQGLSVRNIEKEIIQKGIILSKSTIDRRLKREESTERGEIINQPGRPRKKDNENLDKIMEEMQNNRELTCTQIAKDSTLNKSQANVRTIQRVVKEQGLEDRIMQKRHKIPQSALKKRYQFTQKRKILGGLSLFVYGIISRNGKRKIISIHENKNNNNMNSQVYCDILKKHVIKEFNILKGQQYHLVTDNAGPHRSKETKAFLDKENISKISLSKYSPDLNLIEGIWAQLKNKIWQERKSLNTKQEIWKQVSTAFYSSDIDFIIEQYYDSLTDRLKSEVALKGQPTGY
ncbi:hypothetical protein ABPG72_013612 [Tetrahymena utriculariae]